MADPARDRDPLEALSEAWRALSAPAWGEDPDELDAPARAALERLRAAWSALEAPRGALAERAEPVPAPRRAPARTRWLAPSAAAAALLFLLGAAALLGRRGAAGRAGADLAQLEAPAPAAPVSTLPFDAGVSVESLTPERIELTAGNVRLVLLTGPAPADDATDDATDERMDR